MRVSVLLLTYNEETNLQQVFEALHWCDDVLVVDSGSTDRTVDIARAHGARVLTRDFDDFARQRNFGLKTGHFRHEWVLHLDADEIVTPEFTSVIRSLVPEEGIDAYNIPSKTILFGRWIKFAGMYPTYQVRLGHRDRLRFRQVGHGQREDLPPERVGCVETPYLHYSFSHGLFQWLLKHVRYARAEAELIVALRKEQRKKIILRTTTDRRRATKERAAQIPVTLRPLLRFLYVYFVRQGFRDGRAGFTYAFMLAVYEGMTAVMVIEKLMGGNRIGAIDDFLKSAVRQQE